MTKHLKSSEIKGAIIGMLMGDGFIQNTGSNSRIGINHCEKQVDYLNFKMHIINQVTGSDPIVYPRKTFLKKTNKIYKGFGLQSKSLPYFKKIRKLIYDKNGKKYITRKTLNKLTVLGLAIWYMDDGYLSIQMKKSRKNYYNNEERYVYECPKVSSRKIKIATHCFNEDEHNIIKKYFIEKWGIDIVIYSPNKKNNTNQRAIYMNATNSNKFIDIIKPFILLPLFDKKLDMRYNKSCHENGKDIVCSYAKA